MDIDISGVFLVQFLQIQLFSEFDNRFERVLLLIELEAAMECCWDLETNRPPDHLPTVRKVTNFILQASPDRVNGLAVKCGVLWNFFRKCKTVLVDLRLLVVYGDFVEVCEKFRRLQRFK